MTTNNCSQTPDPQPLGCSDNGRVTMCFCDKDNCNKSVELIIENYHWNWNWVTKKAEEIISYVWK